MLPLRGAVLTSNKAKLSKFRFEISRPSDTANDSWQLVARDQVECQKWMDAIQSEIIRDDLGLDFYLVQEIQNPGGVSGLTEVRGNVWVGGDGIITVWNAETYPATVKCTIELKEAISAFTSDKFTVIGPSTDFAGYVWICVSKNVYCFDPDNDGIIGVLQGHRNRVTAICGYKDKIWTAAEGIVMVWSTSQPTNKQFECVKTLETGGQRLMTLTVIGSQIWTAGFSEWVTVWDAETYEEIRRFNPGHEDTIVKILPYHNTVWIGSEDGVISVWK